MNQNNEFDHILDDALREYRDAEPLSGMEDRILRRIAAQPHPSSRRWVWIVSAAAAAMIVAVLWLGLHVRPHQQPVVTQISPSVQQAPVTTAHGDTPLLPAVKPHPAASARLSSRHSSSAVTPQIAQAVAPKPRLKQFPAPTPLTSEEHALVALARTNPNALLARPDDTEKLSISPIEIKPLASESGAPQGEQ